MRLPWGCVTSISYCTSGDVNAYLQEIAGEEFTAKDFRTWGGTLEAAIALAEADPAETETEATKTVAAVMRRVGARLGNTPAVARSSYVSPGVVERGEEQWRSALCPVLGWLHGCLPLRWSGPSD